MSTESLKMVGPTSVSNTQLHAGGETISRPQILDDFNSEAFALRPRIAFDISLGESLSRLRLGPFSQPLRSRGRLLIRGEP